ncbi:MULTISPECIES: LppY/LpqO family protein [Streptomyces]|uniref:LppY/LpqO family protein n=1 Tax=Streptomyces TaxID=1883 RepID=UPI00163C347B|nr:MULTISPECIES: LppY/LpqO family protein [Streptomyces]MBC2878657.1 DUF1259 domain-containing protein [Streptomyces sp. TYQ1024]UBI35103.1 DUF1259 domain-containing protein [Streptomyces mobaraensis]UKW27697.1 DUF1259 domain-containing protein [Streptomyces sp. TYQ1024]
MRQGRLYGADKGRRRAARRSLMAGTVLLSVLLTAGAARPGDAHHARRIEPSVTRESDWRDVATALGHQGVLVDRRAYGIGFPRADLDVVSKGYHVKAIGSFVSFIRYPDRQTMMMGELAVTEREVRKVLDVLNAHGIAQTSVHKHLPTHSPALWWVHFHAMGTKPLTMARGLRAALDATGTPAVSGTPRKVVLGLDQPAVDKALGARGRAQGRVYKVTFARRETVADHGRVLPRMTGATSALIFQPVGGGKVLLNGDIAVVAKEAPATMKALRRGGVDIISFHSHMLTDEPRLFFLHLWAVGDPVRIANNLRSAIRHTNAAATATTS